MRAGNGYVGENRILENILACVVIAVIGLEHYTMESRVNNIQVADADALEAF